MTTKKPAALAWDQGEKHGWIAAEYAAEYHMTEAQREDSLEHAQDQYPTVMQRLAYRAGFRSGWQRFTGEQTGGKPDSVRELEDRQVHEALLRHKRRQGL